MSHSDYYFSSTDDLRNLSHRIAKGGVINMGAQMLRFLLQTGSMIVLARLLTPDDFGLVGMVTVIMNLVVFFRDFGLTQATVQRTSITRQQISNLFWFNIVVSILVAGGFAACAPLVADFYKRDALAPIVWVISLGVFIEGVGLQHRALMLRAMQFGKLALVDVTTQLICVIVAIYMGFSGYGYWALVAFNISGTVFRTVLYSLSTGWVPNLPRRRSGTKPFIVYGSNLFGFNVLNYFSRNADDILIGKFIGANALGFYSQAYRLLMLPLQQINGPLSSAVIPALSRLQNDAENYKKHYYQSLSVVLFITFFAVGLLMAVSGMLIPALLGEQWAPSVPIFQALLPAAYISAMNVTTGWVFISLGTTDRQLKWTLFAAPFTVCCMATGLPYGVLGVAVGTSVSFLLIRIPYMLYAYKNTPITFLRVLCIIGYPLLLSLTAAGAVTVFLSHYENRHSELLILIIACALYAVFYLLTDILLWRSSSATVQGVRFFLKRKRS